MELIERVARAICKAQFGHLRGYEGRETSYHRLAKAAICAMLDGVESNLSAVQYDPAPCKARKHRIAAMRKEVE